MYNICVLFKSYLDKLISDTLPETDIALDLLKIIVTFWDLGSIMVPGEFWEVYLVYNFWLES